MIARRGCSFSLLLLASSAAADLPVPGSVDFELVSPTEDYHLFVDNDQSSEHYYPPFKALFDVQAIDRTGTWGLGNPLGHDHGFEILGFDEPDFNGEVRGIYFWNCGGDASPSCDNGMAPQGQIVMPTDPGYLNRSQACTRMVLGHELFHHVQFAYANSTAPSWQAMGNWVIEGQARAMQDKIYSDLDLDPDASCTAGYVGAVKSYLAGSSENSPQQQRSIWNNSYRAALWWTYLMEQFGGVTDNNPIYTIEPVTGTDFLVQWYEQALLGGENGDSFATTDNTIKWFDPSNSFLATFRRFVLANIIKDMDLSNVSPAFRSTYSYRDEDPNGPINQDLYAQVGFGGELAVSNASPIDSELFGTEAYGSEYFDIDISQCATGRVVRVNFDPSDSDLFFGQPLIDFGAWGLVVGQSSDGSGQIDTLRPAKYYKKLDGDWSVSFVQPNNPYERAFATTSGILGPLLGELSVECGTPDTIGPSFPLANPLNPVTPGPGDVLTYGEICATPAAPTPAMDPSDYRVAVDGEPVLVLAVEPRDDGHCLQIEIPPSSTGRRQDVSVGLGQQTTTIPDLIVRNNPAPNVMVAIDTSSTMLLPPDNPKLTDTQRIAKAFARMLLPTSPRAALPKLGLVDFAGDDTEPNSDARVASRLVNAEASGLSRFDNAVDALTSGPNRFTSFGDAIQVALDEFAVRGDANQRKHLVLITDGAENEGTFWADLKSTVQASGVIIHTVALGATTDQPLAFDIARTTGGRYAFVPVSGTEVDHVALAQELAALAAEITSRSQIGRHSLQLDQTDLDFVFGVPPQTAGLLLPAVQAAREAAANNSAALGELVLTAPDGTETRLAFDFSDLLFSSYQLGGSDDLPAGNWRAKFVPATGVGGELMLDIQALRTVPLVADIGFAIPANASMSVGGTRTESIGAAKSISVNLFDGCAASASCTTGEADQPLMTGRLPNQAQPIQQIFDRLEFGAPPGTSANTPTEEIGFYYNKIAFNYAGSATGLADDGLAATEGSYRYQITVPIHYDGYTVKLMGSDSFAVNASLRVADLDGDGLPGIYEDLQSCLDSARDDASMDPDDDGLPSIGEFLAGTDPCAPDSDRGGETDGSELRAGRDPLLSTDDALPGIPIIQFGHEVTHVLQQRSAPRQSIVVQFSNSSRFGNLTLKRGIPRSTGDSFFDVFVDIDPTTADGSYIDRGVVPGTEYCYQLEAIDRAGNASRPSNIICAVAANDPNLPWGDLLINGGRPRTQNPQLSLAIGLYNKDPATTEMQFDVDGMDTGWIPYSGKFETTVSSTISPRTIFASMRLRDNEGNVSQPYQDSIELWSADSLGSLAGRVVLEGVGPNDEPGLAGVTVYLDNPAEPPAYTDANGHFWFEELKPGDHTASSGRTGWIERVSFGTGSVQPGQTTDVGQVVMALGSERLFGNGFE